MTRAENDVSRLAHGPTEHARKVLAEMPAGDRYRPIPRGEKRRFDYAVDRILNSATMAGHIDAFWRFVDGDNTAIEEFPS